MREILFKAKRLDNGEWVEGNLIHVQVVTGIKDGELETEYQLAIQRLGKSYAKIDPETICQYTGLNDKNGNKIWENDILKGFEYPYLSDGNHNYYAEVTWFDNCPAFGLYTFKNPKSQVRGISEGNTEFMEEWESGIWEVIGNIFDNPELEECE